MRKYENKLESDVRKVIKEKRVEDSFRDPSILAALFHLISPSRKKMRKTLFCREDVDEFVKVLQVYSYRAGFQYQVSNTLETIETNLSKRLERYKEYSVLPKELKRRVLFYVLMLCLPNLVNIK